MSKEINREDISDAAQEIARDVDQLDRIMMCAFRDIDDVDKMFKQAEDVKRLADEISADAWRLAFVLGKRKKQSGAEND